MKQGISRRNFLKISGTGAACAFSSGVWLSTLPNNALAESCFGGGKTLVYIYLQGGMASHIFLPPTSGAALTSYIDNNPQTAVGSPTEIGGQRTPLSITGTSSFGLHPNMAALQAIVNNRSSGWKGAIVNKTGYPNPNGSHDESHMIIATGDRTNYQSKDGFLAALANQMCGGKNLSFFSFMGRSPEVESSGIDPLYLTSLSNVGFTNDADTDDSAFGRNIYDAMRLQVPQQNESQLALKKVWDGVQASMTDLSQARTTYNALPSNQRGNFPNEGLSNQLKDVAALIRGGISPAICAVMQGGFDRHDDAVPGNNTLFTRFNAALSAFQTDMSLGGKLNDVVILVTTEFGRNSFENKNTRPVNGQDVPAPGHDHGAGTVTMAIGTDIIPGIHGPEYQAADFYNPKNVQGAKGVIVPEVDIREVYSPVISYLGGDPAAIFTDNKRLPNSGIRII